MIEVDTVSESTGCYDVCSCLGFIRFDRNVEGEKERLQKSKSNNKVSCRRRVREEAES
jgi:hypothetical protein